MHTARYGASIRKLFNKAIKAKRTRYECPKCHKLKLCRKGTAVWTCKSCDTTFAGAAYSFTSEAGEIAARSINEYAKSA
ncbi:MAG: 50S ribosomal protein L37ae [Candidatus Micrarchaeota archaeon]